MLELKSLRHSFENKTVLCDLNFIFQAGKSYLLTGDSGVGKSTLAKIISGHLPPGQGEVYLSGKKTTANANADILLVHQEDDLFPWLRVAEQVAIGKQITNEALPDANSLLMRLGLADSANLWPHQLSGGMKKRLALGRALFFHLKVLILDETFSSLDKKIRLAIYSDLKKLIPEQTITIFISHDSNDLEIFRPTHLKLEAGCLHPIT